MRSEQARIGMKVKVANSYRLTERQGMVGRIVGRYGGDEYVAVEVRFPDGECRLFWPGDLEEIVSPRPWWHTLLGSEK